MSASVIVCPHCAGLNRVPSERLGDGAKCGTCKKALFVGKPQILTPDNFTKTLTRNELPVVVDFWAPWCGPCKMMGPMFEQAAAKMEPYVRFAKLDTEAYGALAAPYNIRSIPTMAMFKNGKEIARVSGAMDSSGIVAWVTQNR